jgi:hypothetical protein
LGAVADVNRNGTRIRTGRPDRRGEYRVVPQLSGGSGDEVYMVVAPSGVPLHFFDDIRDAPGEAAVLNNRQRRLESSESA